MTKTWERQYLTMSHALEMSRGLGSLGSLWSLGSLGSLGC